MCEGKLSLKECEEAVKMLKPGKTPGNDGLPVEFYQTFWKDIGPILVETHNFAYDNQMLSTSQRQAVINTIEKKGQDRMYLENWRPISLLNVDLKIASKAIAIRIEKVLPTRIHTDQVGYVKKRYSGEVIRLIEDVKEYTEDENKPGIMLFLDFEKAFDSLNWIFLHEVLKNCGFGTSLRQWVKLFYSNIQSCVLNNGWSSEYFQLSQGVRQGDPLSPYLFVLAVEILAIAIRKDENIKGITINAHEIKLAQYADDTTLFLRDFDSVRRIMTLLECFYNVSGLKLNIQKTELFLVGSLKHAV